MAKQTSALEPGVGETDIATFARRVRVRAQPAAQVLARAIEERYGYQHVGPEVLDVQLLNVSMWEDGWHAGTLGDALFSHYRL